MVRRGARGELERMLGATTTSRRSSASCKAAPGVKALECRPGKERDEKLSVPWSSHVLCVGEKLDVSQALEELLLDDVLAAVIAEPGAQSRWQAQRGPDTKSLARRLAPGARRGDESDDAHFDEEFGLEVEEE
eukprot:CAMPEP_0203947394 /NCGR_PEP_ID=MMETSP0359-20131031/82381_1 /ASSEMBLY_ACC=CAM_ASM_000338 /TAXON_ID=268821 /ORGANISM="Scrippsiella Hangoei, Strain SHTV-5" /LENGTH=132 /DNA_ID=CAMNT_0050878807 /DNA_START=386 /DNA_END=783 /DNA_ORIENTATION=-